MVKKHILIAVLCGTAALLAGCASASAKMNQADTTAVQSSAAESTAAQGTGATEDGKTERGQEQKMEGSKEKHHVEIVVKDYGTIKVELDARYAPIAVENFIKLAKDGFYDGLTFHRIIDGFMIQGGDPEGTGMGGSETMIKGEFSKNGIENPLSHTRGVISMARSGNSMDSASSQFFIMHKDSTYLDGDYAAFGHVTEGMEIVDQICSNTLVYDNNGSVKTENQPVMERVTVID